ncbi:MAG: hypothetical protein A2Y73_05205 [Chloroflexi bacterium RBG_13_56_8]|nr:MAG: hypothetical protein A2Y73_05205 [Chloroflexi bacterium RBG_13_56_8]
MELLQQATTHQLKLRFFDLEAEIRTDSQVFLDLFFRMYHHFQASSASVSPPPTAQAKFTLLSDPHNPWGVPVLLLDEEVVPLRDPQLLEGYAYERVLSSIVARVRSHFLIHASVASHDEKGIVLVADSSYGKTTLILELVRRGLKFLSDELAALGRADHLVHPFPRCLRVRPGTLALIGLPALTTATEEWLGKLLIDVDEIRPHSLGGAVPISHIIILQDPAEDRETRIDSAERSLEIHVDHLNEDFLPMLREIEGVRGASADTERTYPLLTLRISRGAYPLPRIEALCQAQQMVILDIIKRGEHQPDFDVPARLGSISRSQAMMEILRRFQGGHQSVLLQEELGGSATKLFLELADVLSEAECHQLFVGNLREMGDLVCDLAEA